jgi:hypothetical protein
MTKAKRFPLPPTAQLSTTYMDATRGFCLGDEKLPIPDMICTIEVDGWYHVDLSALFKSLRGDFGYRCRKMYIDLPDGHTARIGWIFQKKYQYDDSAEIYEREVCVCFEDENGKPIPLPLPL